jgi:hypothetical protein
MQIYVQASPIAATANTSPPPPVHMKKKNLMLASSDSKTGSEKLPMPRHELIIK